MWEFLNADRWTMLGKAPRGRRIVVVQLRRTPKYAVIMRSQRDSPPGRDQPQRHEERDGWR